MPRFLLFGSGLVAGPIVEYLCRFPTNFVSVCSAEINQAKALTANHPSQTVAVHADATQNASFAPLIRNHDIIISYLPAPLHPPIAEECIKQKKNMVTASYISPAMARLHKQAEDADVLILNEIGLDPGLDHLSAMQIIDHAKANKCKIEAFTSWCGGLPAPEAANNPIGYKFSWSPKGAITAATNPAKWKEDGQMREIPGGGSQLLRSARVLNNIHPDFSLHGYANRDSLQYIPMYGLDESNLKTMLRGTLRYPGYSLIMGSFLDLGLASSESVSYLAPDSPAITWSDYFRKVLNVAPGEDLKEKILNRLKLDPKSEDAKTILAAYEWFGFLSSSEIKVKKGTHLDTFCSHLERKLAFLPNERDLVVLAHLFSIRHPDGRLEKKKSTLVEYGHIGGFSAMARTVAYPTAIACRLISEGRIKGKGVVAPVTPHFYEPLLVELEKEGIKFHEESKFE